MIRYVFTGVAGAIVGAGIIVVLVLVFNPIPSSLVCSVNAERTVVDCTDENGKPVNIPHTVRIR
jgi:hypothetical protein